MSIYFSKYPKTIYNNKLLTDVLRRVVVYDNRLDNPDLYYNYLIKDGDTPEIIADKYYGNSEYHWILMLTNNIFDGIFEFPMGYQTFNNYIEDKYGPIASGIPTSLKILQEGNGYIDGTYNNVDLQITNYEKLEKIGYNLKVDVVINEGRIISVTVVESGSGYDINSEFTLNTTEFSVYDSLCRFSILNTMSGFQYSKETIDPLLGYNNSISIYDSISHDKISEEIFAIGKESYDKSIPYNKIVELPDGTSVIYKFDKYAKNIYEVELNKNESKRLIKILKEEYVKYFVTQFNTLIGSL